MILIKLQTSNSLTIISLYQRLFKIRGEWPSGLRRYPDFINDIVILRNPDSLAREKYDRNLEISKPNQATFSEIWNALRYRIKISENLSSFKAIIKCWDGNCCLGKFCQHTTSRQIDYHKDKNTSFFMKLNA